MQECNTGNMSSDARIGVIEKAQRYLLPLLDIDYPRLKLQESSVNQDVPTIGAEIEIPWSARFSDYSQLAFGSKSYVELSELEKQQFTVLCDELDSRFLPMYETVTKFGIPRDKNQKFWEFAHSPVRHHETLSTEIAILAWSGLLPEGQHLPLHITLGNIMAGSGAYYLQMMTEIIGGSTADRIRSPIGNMPIYERKWARKAPNGLKERKSFELRNASNGFEMRTLIFNSAEQVAKILRASQILGLALSHRRAVAQDLAYNNELVDAWNDSIDSIKQIEAAGIQVQQSWQGPEHDPSTWSRYADFLELEGEHAQLRFSIAQRIEKIVDHIVDVAAKNTILHRGSSIV